MSRRTYRTESELRASEDEVWRDHGGQPMGSAVMISPQVLSVVREIVRQWLYDGAEQPPAGWDMRKFVGNMLQEHGVETEQARDDALGLLGVS